MLHKQQQILPEYESTFIRISPRAKGVKVSNCGTFAHILRHFGHLVWKASCISRTVGPEVSASCTTSQLPSSCLMFQPIVADQDSAATLVEVYISCPLPKMVSKLSLNMTIHLRRWILLQISLTILPQQ